MPAAAQRTMALHIATDTMHGSAGESPHRNHILGYEASGLVQRIHETDQLGCSPARRADRSSGIEALVESAALQEKRHELIDISALAHQPRAYVNSQKIFFYSADPTASAIRQKLHLARCADAGSSWPTALFAIPCGQSGFLTATKQQPEPGSSSPASAPA
jgi:hypothetical protein